MRPKKLQPGILICCCCCYCCWTVTRTSSCMTTRNPRRITCQTILFDSMYTEDATMLWSKPSNAIEGSIHWSFATIRARVGGVRCLPPMTTPRNVLNRGNVELHWEGFNWRRRGFCCGVVDDTNVQDLLINVMWVQWTEFTACQDSRTFGN